jgi:phosphoglycolate phosphatase-like HAD superfamily hydrolase
MLTPLVALFDVDNTLLDNDRFSRELDARLTQALGVDGRARYRSHYERLRDERGFADYLAPLQLLRREFEDDPDLLGLSSFLFDYPFAERLYPGAADAVAHLGGFATTAILSDGDIVFQPHKIRRSGLWELVGGNVLVTLHKERELDSVRRRVPAGHYILVDDKPKLLDRAKAVLGDLATTIFVRQGHYAAESDADRATHPPDLRLDSIAELASVSPKDLQ